MALVAPSWEYSGRVFLCFFGGNPPAMRCRGGGMPRCARISYAEPGEAQPSRGRLWLVLRRQPLPPLIRLCFAKPLRNGMTATGSHEYFYSLRGTPPPRGRLFPVPAGFFVDSYRSIFATWRAGRASPARSEPSLPATHITASRRYLLFASAGPHGGGPRRAAGGSRKRRNYCPR